MPATEEKRKQLLPLLQTVFTGAILVLLAALAIGAVVEFGTLHRSLALIEEEVQQLEMDDVNEAVLALTDAANKLADVDIDTLNETAASLRDAADKLAGIDIEEVNKTVSALTDAANNLSNLDIAQLNELINSLNSVATKLSSITSLFGK